MAQVSITDVAAASCMLQPSDSSKKKKSNSSFRCCIVDSAPKTAINISRGKVYFFFPGLSFLVVSGTGDRVWGKNNLVFFLSWVGVRGHFICSVLAWSIMQHAGQGRGEGLKMLAFGHLVGHNFHLPKVVANTAETSRLLQHSTDV